MSSVHGDNVPAHIYVPNWTQHLPKLPFRAHQSQMSSLCIRHHQPTELHLGNDSVQNGKLCRTEVMKSYRLTPIGISFLQKQLRFLCPNAVDGCSVRMSNSGMQGHIANCPFRPFVCTMEELDKCKQEGEKITSDSIMFHFNASFYINSDIRQHPGPLQDAASS